MTERPKRMWSCAACYVEFSTRRKDPPTCTCGATMTLGKIPARTIRRSKPKKHASMSEAEEDRARNEALRQRQGPVRRLCPEGCTCLLCQLAMPGSPYGSSSYPSRDRSLTSGRTTPAPSSDSQGRAVPRSYR